MRRFVATLAAVAVVGFATSTASASDGYHEYGGYIEYHGYHAYGGWQGHHYRPYPQYYSYPPVRSYRSPARSYGFETYNEAVRRIMATHSRFRYSPHPRSYYKSPPYMYGYGSW